MKTRVSATIETRADPRTTLLGAVIAAIERNGLGGRSLRDLANDAGTSSPRSGTSIQAASSAPMLARA